MSTSGKINHKSNSKRIPKYYGIHPRFFVAVDSVIFGFDGKELYLLILKRNFEPAKGCWSLMGGFVRENEAVDDAAIRILKDLTGLDNIFIRQVGTFGNVDRDPAARVVSVAYYALINIYDYDENLAKKYNAHWIKIDEIPELVFDHLDITKKAQEMMRIEAKTTSCAFNLLPDYFTLTKLQQMFQAVLGESLDKRNFRKKISELGYIKPTGKIDRLDSKRGAMLYYFDKKAYCDYKLKNKI